MRYFMTGATGFIGKHVARQLREAGHDVVALVRTPQKAHFLADMGVEMVQGDVTDKASIRPAMEGADGVFHIAGWYKVGVRDTSAAEAVNVQGTRNVLETMQELGIPKGVYTSTVAVNSDTKGVVVDESYRFTGRHLSVYDRTKAEAHRVAEAFIAQGLPLVIVQPGLVYGPGDEGPSHELMVQYLTQKLPMLPQGVAFSWAHVEDIARGHILAMEKGRIGESYFLTGPVHTLAEGLKLAEEITGVPGPRMSAPPGMLKAMSALMALVEKFVPVPSNYSSEYLRVSAGTTYIGDNAKARRELGWTPRPLKEGLAETLAYERQRLAEQAAA